MSETTARGIRARYKGLTLPVKFAGWAALLLLLYTVIGFWLIPLAAKKVLEKKLPPLLHRAVSIGDISFNPYTLGLAVENFHLVQKEGGGDLLAFDRLYVNLESLSLFKRALIIQAVSLSGPRVEFSHLGAQNYSFSDLLTGEAEKKGAPPEKSRPFQFAIQNIEIKDGRILFHDLPKKTDHTVTGINLGVPALSNLPYQVETYVQPSFAAVINGTPFAVGGQSKPFAKSLDTEVELKATGINIPEYLAYIPNPTGLLLQSALLDIDARLRLLARPDNTFRLALIGRLAVRELAVTDKGGRPYLQLPKVAVTLADSDLLAREVRVSEINIESPAVNFERLADGTLLPISLLSPAEKADQAKETAPASGGGAEKDKSLKLNIDKIAVKGGRVDFLDAAAAAKLPGKKTPLHFTLANLDVLSENFSTEADKLGSLQLSLLLNEASPVQVQGQYGITPLQARISRFKIEGINLPEYLAYIPNPTALALKSALLDVDTSLHYQARPDQKPLLGVVGRVGLRKLAVTDQAGHPYLQVPDLSVALTDSDLLANEVHVSEIAIKSPSVNLERRADNTILPLALLTPAEQTAKPPSPPGKEARSAGEPEAGPPLKLLIDTVALKGGRVDFLDTAVGAGQQEPVPAHLTLTGLDLQTANLSNAPNTLGALNLSAILNEAGRLRAQGQLGIAPVRTTLHLQLTDLALKPFQPYIGEQARIVVAGGKLSLSGDLGLTPKSGGGLKSDFQGEADLAQLATLDSVLGEDLLKWGNLGLKKIRFSSDPGQLAIGEINLTGLYAKALIGKDGVVNLATLRPEPVKKEAAAAAPPAAPEATAPFSTSIGNIAISGGRLDFEDRSVTPAYGNSLDDLHGSITNLSSMTESSAQVELAGILDRQAPMKISGRINPLRSDLLVDLKVDFSDINLSPLSPYSGKFIGYKLDKGKLNLDLQYNIAGRKLDSQNKAFIDQLTLGDAVASPDAANLPVKLALALLQDRHGGINLNVPVYGSLDDPDFSVFRIVIKVLLNLIAKAATSPMALLGALIPEGQDLQYIPFPAGQAAISPEAAAKLATVENVLYQRPALKMDLIGKVDPTADGAALARQHLLNMVKLQKVKADGKAAQAAGEEAGPELTAEEYPAFLALAYQSARPAKPSQKPAATPPPPPGVAEMEGYLLSTIKVNDDELRLLALARANQVLAALMADGKVEPGRLFVVEPKPAKPGEAAAVSQVELVIK